MKILEVKNLSKSFKNELVLDNVSFYLKKGETLGIIGTSGGGKTTILRCLNFLETPDKGEIIVNNETLFNSNMLTISEDEKRQKRKHFGLVFQNFNLFPQYSVKDNIELAMKLQNVENIEEVSTNLIKSLGLQSRINAYPDTLSGGQKQRVAIARALALKPEILCFDEPTSALDPNLINDIVKIINSLKKQKQSMIVVSHDMHFIKKVADRVCLLLDGKIIETASTNEFFKNPKNKKTKEFLSI